MAKYTKAPKKYSATKLSSDYRLSMVFQVKYFPKFIQSLIYTPKYLPTSCTFKDIHFGLNNTQRNIKFALQNCIITVYIKNS